MPKKFIEVRLIMHGTNIKLRPTAGGMLREETRLAKLLGLLLKRNIGNKVVNGLQDNSLNLISKSN